VTDQKENVQIIGGCLVYIGTDVDYQTPNNKVKLTRQSIDTFPDENGGYKYQIFPSLTNTNYIVQVQRDYGILSLPSILREFNFTSVVHNKTPSSFIVTFIDPYGSEIKTKIPHTILIYQLI